MPTCVELIMIRILTVTVVLFLVPSIRVSSLFYLYLEFGTTVVLLVRKRPQLSVASLHKVDRQLVSCTPAIKIAKMKFVLLTVIAPFNSTLFLNFISI